MIFLKIRLFRNLFQNLFAGKIPKNIGKGHYCLTEHRMWMAAFPTAPSTGNSMKSFLTLWPPTAFRYKAVTAKVY